MRIVVKVLFVLLPLLSLLAANVAEAKGTGMVLDVRGEVIADGRDKSRPLEITDTLDAGMRITIGKAGEVSFVFYPTREQFTVTGPAVLRVEAKSVKTLQGAAPKVKKLPEEKTQAVQAYLGRIVPAALVMKVIPGRKMPPQTIYPANGEVVLETNPEFAWSASAGPVSLILLDGDKKLLERTVDGSALPLPTELALAPGHRYRWSVEAEGRTAVAEFTVAAVERRRRLSGSRPPDLAPPADWAIYAIAMEQAGAMVEARRAWGRVAALRPDSDMAKDLVR
jgi:hypothetical protein